MEKEISSSDISSNLTTREKEVMSLLSKGLLDKEMAYTLGLSLNTVKNHLKNIYHKLAVDNRLEAIIKYYHLDEYRRRTYN